MAKKRKRRRASLITKAINIGVLGVAFSNALMNLMAGRWGQIVYDYSAGLGGNPQTNTAGGKFDKEAAMRAFGPMVAAFLLKKGISMVRKTARV